MTVIVVCTLSFPCPVRPQSAAAPALTGPQAAQVLEMAREAQREFEELRRDHLPRNPVWSRDACSRRVGRMCWRYRAESRWPPLGEPVEVTQARDALLQTLAGTAQILPRDPWILGQRVRYLLEAGRHEDALVAARRCGGAPISWCRALEGLALHREGRYSEAEGAFDEGLETMGPEEARRWTDPSLLVGSDLRSRFEEAAAAGPEPLAELVERFWALADPLYIVPGNDRRSEHLARRTLNRIYADAATPRREAWGTDLDELQLRYGPELAWEKVLPRVGEYVPVSIVGYEDPDLRGFLPSRELLENPRIGESAGWVASMYADAPSGYAPAYAPVFLPMDARLVVLTRGDHALVAATYRLPPDTTFRTRRGLRGPYSPPPAFRVWPPRAGFLLRAPGEAPLHAALGAGQSQGVLVVDVPAGEYLASVEVLAPMAGRAGRMRRGLRVPYHPPNVPRLSEILVLEGDSLPATPLEALQRLRVEDRITTGEPLVVGWELWGLGWREEIVGYRLVLEPTERGLLDRVRALFGPDGRLPILQWEEPAPEEPGAALRSVSVAMPDLEPGVYRLHLEVTLQGREPLSSSQRIEVVDAGVGGPRGPP